MSNTEPRPLAWLCELAQQDGTTRQQIVTEDPDGLRWNDIGEPSPFKVTPLYARALAQPTASDTPQDQHPLYVAGWKAGYKHGAWQAQHCAAQPAVAVATVTECEACFTPDACQLRGKCDHYAAEQLRVQQPAASGEPVAHMAEVLEAAWAKAEPKHSVTLHPMSYRATFVDMARAALAATAQPAPARVPPPEDPWRKLYRRAINEANGLTNYVEDRPELRSAERRLTAIEAEARALAAAPDAQKG